MGTQGNNTSAKAELLREAFFDSYEKEYFQQLLQNPVEKKYHSYLKSKDGEALYIKAKQLVDEVEAGEYDEEEMKEIEITIAHLLAAIEDLHRVKVLEKTLDDDYGLGV